MDDELVICRCEEVTLGEIKAAIAAGATTLGEVRIRTRAGMGLCQGRTCGRLVAQLLARHSGQPSGAVHPRRARAPVRPLPSELFASSRDEADC
jgi:NAD(P)H-nitrite reductase large subunit